MESWLEKHWPKLGGALGSLVALVGFFLRLSQASASTAAKLAEASEENRRRNDKLEELIAELRDEVADLRERLARMTPRSQDVARIDGELRQARRQITSIAQDVAGLVALQPQPPRRARSHADLDRESGDSIPPPVGGPNQEEPHE